ncbi:MAG: hypothetical protein QOH71_3818 [Blastocatellia bacterium]|jgi:Tfp pilus assembly protein PilF|nr:hypothetical protein [Blastocatellia bacterium]
MVNRLNNPHAPKCTSRTPACLSNPLIKILCILALLLSTALAHEARCLAQAGGHELYGDLKVDESKVQGTTVLSYVVILYSTSGNVLGRLSLPNRGRYQFLNLADADYDVAVEVENKEIARVRVSVHSPFRTDFRRDIELEWRTEFKTTSKPATVFADDFYKRSRANEKFFRAAQSAVDQKKYETAISSLRELLKSDPADFQAWTELGTIYLMQQQLEQAEQSYLAALRQRPMFFLALLDLGRLNLMQKKFARSIEVLAQAVKARRQSPDANYFLAEAYLESKKGSLAVDYFKEALRLAPQGMAEAHLRLAALYNGAGMKSKAVAEYEQFLKKKPDYPDRQKLEKYIAENKKR